VAKGARKEPAGNDIDDLFRLPLDEFTAARNALVTKLKKSGDTAAAGDVKQLSRPPVSAWAVNQLYWRHRPAFDQLLATGEAFRKAQAAQLGGKQSDLRGTLDARRESLSALSRLAADVLREAGHNPSPDLMRRVTTTLEALASYGTHPGAPQAGRLTGDVDAPGFEALAALVPQVGESSARPTEPRVLEFRHQKKAGHPKKLSPEEARRQQEAEERAARAAAKAAVLEAEKTLRDARKQAERAEALLKKGAAAAKEAEREKAALEARYEKLTAAAESTRQEARRMAAEAEDAAQAVEDAERALEKARREARSIE
jgi:hypothetical protein